MTTDRSRRSDRSLDATQIADLTDDGTRVRHSVQRLLADKERYTQWGTLVSPPYTNAMTSQNSDDPDTGGLTANVDGSLRSTIFIQQVDPSANTYTFNRSWVYKTVRVPYLSDYVAVGGKYRRFGSVSLRIIDRNGPSTLDLGIYQQLFVQLWRWNGASWDNLGIKHRPLFSEERRYDVGQGGNDDVSWPVNDTVDYFEFFEQTFAPQQWISASVGIYNAITYNAFNFTLTTRNEMNADVKQISISGDGSWEDIGGDFPEQPIPWPIEGPTSR